MVRATALSVHKMPSFKGLQKQTAGQDSTEPKSLAAFICPLGSGRALSPQRNTTNLISCERAKSPRNNNHYKSQRGYLGSIHHPLKYLQTGSHNHWLTHASVRIQVDLEAQHTQKSLMPYHYEFSMYLECDYSLMGFFYNNKHNGFWTNPKHWSVL